MPAHYDFRPVIADQHTAARAYFLCVMAMLFFESMLLLPGYFLSLRKINVSPQRRRGYWIIYVWLHKLFTQPSPLPVLTNHHVASLSRCLIFAGLNVLWGWNRIRYTTDYQIYGWLTVANGGLALLLPTRTNLFSMVARIPAPTLLMYHRWAGMAAVIHAGLHFGLTAQRYIATSQFDTVLQNARIRVGILAWAALALMFLTSIRPLRRRAFELFSFTHFLFLVFVAGALYHAAHAPEFLLPGLCLWGVDRLWRVRYSFRHVMVLSATHYAGDVLKIKLQGVKTTAPAQMAWVQIPSLSWVQWHPFTIMGSPSDDTGTIAIRGIGRYTKKAQKMLAIDGVSAMDAQHALSDQVKIRLDGPYGVAKIQWTRYPVVALVAGGIGITPGLSIASHVVRQASMAGPSVGGWHLYLLWSVSDRKHVQWFEEELKGLAALASRPEVPVSLEVAIHVTGSRFKGREEHEMEESVPYEGPGVTRIGRPDITQWLRDIRTAQPGLDVAVSICGPQTLKNDARRAAAHVSGREGLFFVEEEVFEF